MKGHLSDIGYEQQAHDALLEQVRAKGLALEDTIEAVAEIYQTLYEQDAYEINCGNCEEFAADVMAAMNWRESDPNCPCDALWHDNMPDCTATEANWWSHKFLRFQNRFYDAECPEGVDHWRELPCFVNNPAPPDSKLYSVELEEKLAEWKETPQDAFDRPEP